MGMCRAELRAVELLAYCRDRTTLGALCLALEQHGVRVSIATDLAALRTAFFESGGHDALLLGPDLPAGAARTAAESLLAVDLELRVVAIGPDHARSALPHQVARLTAHHPASRAGVAAVLRALART